MAREMKDSGIEWIGKLPENWQVAQLKRFVNVNNGKEIENEINNKDAIPVYGSGGVFKYTDSFMFDGEAVMFGRKGTLGKPIYANGKFWTVDTMYYLTFKASLYPKFNYYQLQIFDWMPHITQTALPSVVASEIVSCHFAFPDYNEQKRIVSFLDAKCACIDEVMEQTRTSIEEYKKLKQAVITQAVTKGIRPNRPMKDSGVDWIGKIPQNWEIRRIKALFTLRDEKNYLPLEEVNLISLYTDKGVVLHSDLEETTGNKASNADGYKKVYENDIVVNIILCWMGAIGRSSYRGVTSPAYDIYIPSPEIECQFYHYYFRTPGFSGDCFKRGKGIMAMRWRTYSDQFRDIHVVMPPKEEQEEIVAYLDNKIVEIDSLIKKKQVFLDELEAYRKSLIFEYVTGKKDVK